MKFHKEKEINPFASFLPLAAQIPVFIGLFYPLRTRLRGASVRASRRRTGTPMRCITTSRSSKRPDRRPRVTGSMDRAGCSSTT